MFHYYGEYWWRTAAHIDLKLVFHAMPNCTCVSLLISPRTKWPPYRRRYFQTYYDESIFYSSSSFTEVCSQGSNWHRGKISSGNGLAPDRRQAITWTSADPVHRRIYAAPGGDELTALNILHLMLILDLLDSENIMHVDVFMRELSYEIIEQQGAYSMTSLWSK